jgi:hypothetical protein
MLLLVHQVFLNISHRDGKKEEPLDEQNDPAKMPLLGNYWSFGCDPVYGESVINNLLATELVMIIYKTASASPLV